MGDTRSFLGQHCDRCDQRQFLDGKQNKLGSLSFVI